MVRILRGSVQRQHAAVEVNQGHSRETPQIRAVQVLLRAHHVLVL